MLTTQIINSIIMAHQFESGFFVGHGAWHGLGTVLDHPPTTAKAIADAGLDWQVNEQAIYTQSVHGLSPVSTHKSLVRSSDYQLLGIVSQQYQPLQNQDTFSWFDFLLHDGDVSLEAAGNSLPVPVQTDDYLDLIDGRVSCVNTPQYSICRRLGRIKRHSKHTLYLDVYDHSGGRGNRIYLGTRIHNQPVDH